MGGSSGSVLHFYDFRTAHEEILLKGKGSADGLEGSTAGKGNSG